MSYLPLGTMFDSESGDGRMIVVGYHIVDDTVKDYLVTKPPYGTEPDVYFVNPLHTWLVDVNLVSRIWKMGFLNDEGRSFLETLPGNKEYQIDDDIIVPRPYAFEHKDKDFLPVGSIIRVPKLSDGLLMVVMLNFCSQTDSTVYDYLCCRYPQGKPDARLTNLFCDDADIAETVWVGHAEEKDAEILSRMSPGALKNMSGMMSIVNSSV